MEEIVKSENQVNALKRRNKGNYGTGVNEFFIVKNWDQDRVEQLYQLFLFASMLLAVKFEYKRMI